MTDSTALHYLVWRNDLDNIKQYSAVNGANLEERDPHGRTPLMLAVCLARLNAAKILIQNGANVNTETDGWTAVQEATATGNSQLVQLVLEERDKIRYGTRMGGIPELLVKLKDVPDFYVEMTWEFTSWVPLVSRMCPSDTYRVYKRGSSVRVDTTLLGFDQSSWVRGSRTYIFTGESQSAKFLEIDHDSQQVFEEEMKMESGDLESISFSSMDQVDHRLSTPLIQTYLDTDNISFQRVKSGFLGWGSDKVETVSGMECKVFAANNVEVVTKTRTEHMSPEDKEHARANKNPLLSIFGPSETEVDSRTDAGSKTAGEEEEQTLPTEEEYFSKNSTAKIGKIREEFRKAQKFKAQLWLCEEYPLSLQEQIMPIVDLLAISNTHFQKLKDFIHMQLPSGFPVKIEIPLFHVINARITFSNIQALDKPVPGVTSIKEDCGRSSAAIDDSVFDVPRGYTKLGGSSENSMRQYAGDEEDLLLQYAIRQSLGNTTSEQVDIWEALDTAPPGTRQQGDGASNVDPSVGVGGVPLRSVNPGLLQSAAPSSGLSLNLQREDRQLQEAIEASMRETAGIPPVTHSTDNQDIIEDDLALALKLSEAEARERTEELQRREEQLQKEEYETLAKVLELSLKDK